MPISGVINNISKGVLDIMLTSNRRPVNLDNIAAGSQVLANNEKFKTMCFNFQEGSGLPKHTHNGNASIFIVEGAVDMEFVGEGPFVLRRGDFLSFDARKEHNIIAVETSKVIITISQ
ncbi:cupin domain-containing protein [Clostridium sp.]|uniref:cupin domain-containing protein n=1 Tax=Clostridium sp. TaxID=1506 RepID=UPI00346449B7